MKTYVFTATSGTGNPLVKHIQANYKQRAFEVGLDLFRDDNRQLNPTFVFGIKDSNEDKK